MDPLQSATTIVLPPFWEYVRLFQAVIGAATGFSGVIFTLWWNARAARRLEIEKFHRERNALVAVLQADLASTRSWVSKLLETAETWKPESEINVKLDALNEAGKLFDANQAKLGLLKKDAVVAVCLVYEDLRSMIPDFLVTGALEINEEMSSKKVIGTWYRLKSPVIPAASFKRHIAMIDTAIKQLEQQ